MSNNLDQLGGTPGRQHGAGTYQMLWDCKFCGTEKLLGLTHRHCPNCGAAQDPAWRYFPSEADMVSAADHKYVGADVICPACTQPNSAAATYCTECGADLATGAKVTTQGERELGTSGAFSNTRRDVVAEEYAARMQAAGVEVGAGAGRSGRQFLGLKRGEWWLVGGVLLVAALLVAGVFAFTYRQDTSGTVTQLTWERSIEIEEFGPVSDGAWDESVPADAYNENCYRKQRSTRKVETGSHQECKDVDQGDGSFRRECRTVKDYRNEPVYDTWCDYKVDRWHHGRTVAVDGIGTSPPPQWPAYQLASGSGSRRQGAERVGDKDEDYHIHFEEDGGKEHTCTVSDQATWERYSIGMGVTLKVDLLGHADCSTLKIAR